MINRMYVKLNITMLHVPNIEAFGLVVSKNFFFMFIEGPGIDILIECQDIRQNHWNIESKSTHPYRHDTQVKS